VRRWKFKGQSNKIIPKNYKQAMRVKNAWFRWNKMREIFYFSITNKQSEKNYCTSKRHKRSTNGKCRRRSINSEHQASKVVFFIIFFKSNYRCKGKLVFRQLQRMENMFFFSILSIEICHDKFTIRPNYASECSKKHMQ